MFVTRGATARMQDEAELAGCAAHEVAHGCATALTTPYAGQEQRNQGGGDAGGAGGRCALSQMISGLADNCDGCADAAGV